MGNGSTSEHIEVILLAYLDKKEKIKRAQEELDGIVTELDELAGSSLETSGSFLVDGIKLKAIVDRKEVGSYKDKALLKDMIKQHPEELGSLFGISISESGRKVFRYMEENEGDPLVQELQAIRKVTQRKPSIKIEPKQ